MSSVSCSCAVLRIQLTLQRCETDTVCIYHNTASSTRACSECSFFFMFSVLFLVSFFNVYLKKIRCIDDELGLPPSDDLWEPSLDRDEWPELRYSEITWNVIITLKYFGSFPRSRLQRQYDVYEYYH
jgi:hypothetical protein